MDDLFFSRTGDWKGGRRIGGFQRIISAQQELAAMTGGFSLFDYYFNYSPFYFIFLQTIGGRSLRRETGWALLTDGFELWRCFL